MLRRAGISVLVALLAMVCVLSGLVEDLAPAAQVVSYIAVGFAVVSFLLSLFEEPGRLSPGTRELAELPQLRRGESFE